MVIRKEPLSALPEYGSVPIAFSATSDLQVSWVENGLGGIRIVEVPLDRPFAKDFDNDEPVTRWLRFGDISHWGIFAAFDDGRRVGGAVVAYDTPGVNMLEGRRELAVLWDIRVHPDVRRTGVGTSLLESAFGFARESGCSVLKIGIAEHEPRRVPFSMPRTGSTSEGLRRGGYADYPDEIPAAVVSGLGPKEPVINEGRARWTSAQGRARMNELLPGRLSLDGRAAGPVSAGVVLDSHRGRECPDRSDRDHRCQPAAFASRICLSCA